MEGKTEQGELIEEPPVVFDKQIEDLESRIASDPSKPKKRLFKQNTIVVVYDFDGTLVPKPMQDYTILPDLKVKSNTFWKKVKEEAHKYKLIK